MNDTLAQSLYHYGLSVEQIAEADSSELAQVPGFSEEKAAEIKANAQKLIDSGQLAEMRKQMLEAEKAAAQQSKLSSDAVFERLKAEVKAHQERERTAESEAQASQPAANANGTESAK